MLLRALAIVALSLIAALPLRAEQIDTAATNAVLIDMNSGAVLLSKEPDAPIPPASMSKLMTVYMVFDAIKSGELKLSDEFTVSEKAWRMGGSQMFVEVGESITVENLLRGVIIQSGNDACVVLAEGLAGSEDAFARAMTRKAKEIGLEHSSFRNATGLPAEGHRMSVRDLAKLGRLIVEEFPELYALYAEREFEWAGIRQSNRNPLLRMDIGADGLKTGYTEEAGYCLVGTAEQDGRRLMMVIAGLPSVSARAAEAERILKWGFRAFETVEILAEGAEVGTAEVWIGAAETVPLVAARPVTVTTEFGEAESISAEIRYEGPLQAPVEKGQQVGVLSVRATGIEPVEVPLLAGEAVAAGGFGEKLKTAAGIYAGKALDAALGRGGETAAQ